MEDFKTRIAGYQVRERIFALFCITVIAIMAMWKLTDAENIVINIIVAISSFMAGRDSKRVDDKKTSG